MATLFVAPVARGGTDENVRYMLFGDIASSLQIVSMTRNERNSSVVFEFTNVQEAQEAQNYLIHGSSKLVTKIKALTPTNESPIAIPVEYNDERVPKGLMVIPDFVSEDFEERLVAEIDSMPWDARIKRRVQHYGFAFQYSKLNVDDSKTATPFPESCAKVMGMQPLIDCAFNQLTINEYLPGIGIASHCDTHSAFTDTIAVLSVCGSTIVDFVSHDDTKRVSVVIPPRSLYLMTGDSRYGWRHAIAARKTDREPGSGTLKPRDPRRISLTFRKCISVTCTCEYRNLCDSQGADLSRPRRLQEG